MQLAPHGGSSGCYRSAMVDGIKNIEVQNPLSDFTNIPYSFVESNHFITNTNELTDSFKILLNF